MVFEPAVGKVAVYVIDLGIEVGREVFEGPAGPGDVDGTVPQHPDPVPPEFDCGRLVTAVVRLETDRFSGPGGDDLSFDGVKGPVPFGELGHDDDVLEPDAGKQTRWTRNADALSGGGPIRRSGLS